MLAYASSLKIVNGLSSCGAGCFASRTTCISITKTLHVDFWYRPILKSSVIFFLSSGYGVTKIRLGGSHLSFYFNIMGAANRSHDNESPIE